MLALFFLATLASPEPFKLGTFERNGDEVIGIVLRDRYVIELARANASLERRFPLWVKLPMPEDMGELIGRYDYGMRERIHAIVEALAESLDDERRPSYVHDLDELIVLPPVRPGVILAAALNYWAHAQEMTTGAPAEMSDASALDDSPVSMDHFWQRPEGDRRQNPYLFFKPPRIAIAHEQPILMKPGREQLDWECELAVVIGKPASHVPIAKAREHVFGYTMMNDVGDREGRGDNRYGSDWLVWKSSDTFAPLGPFIVPKEFVADPQSLDIWFDLSRQRMQDANTELMQHSIDELLHFASNNLILRPGDVIATGTPSGVGMARTPPIFMKPGDVAECSVEGIGTLRNPIAMWSDVMRR
ncbi:MAG TPA: fumarylacetoacetate hydrolase family protein [Vicinamibacteria bacterium]|nr:fumarylacetoacetate hydrolase family protein [Vicinamibacteria bacterium]